MGKDATPERIQRLGDAKEERYREIVRRDGIAPLPGAAEWVARLKAAGWRQAIASSGPLQNMQTVLHALHFDGAMQAIASAEDVHRGKPDPEVFLVAAAKLGVEPVRCVVVEDAPAGIEAARRAGMRCIGVSRKVKLPADLYVESLADLPDDAFERLVSG
jgi:beta-phosphoglucomutase